MLMLQRKPIASWFGVREFSELESGRPFETDGRVGGGFGGVGGGFVEGAVAAFVDVGDVDWRGGWGAEGDVDVPEVDLGGRAKRGCSEREIEIWEDEEERRFGKEGNCMLLVSRQGRSVDSAPSLTLPSFGQFFQSLSTIPTALSTALSIHSGGKSLP